MRRKPNWELFVPAIPFTCFALYMSYGFYQSFQEQRGAAAFFEPVAATVLASQVETTLHRQPGTASSTRVHLPRIEYQYEVDGRRYRSRQFSYFGAAYGSDAEARQVIARYPVGSVQTAYFDPRDPAQAVLNKASPSAWWKHLWFPALFVLVGVLGLFGGWRGWLRRHR
ncbi:MAG: DUF3592 domain-containing protein [Pseudomonadaceae bacterium]|nr:DUF3592 domain-containing protein [Pseudomonadaceae bacterium]